MKPRLRKLPYACAGVTDARGKTPLDYAIQEGHTATIEYLQSLRAPSATPSQSTDYQYPLVDQQPQGTYICSIAVIYMRTN